MDMQENQGPATHFTRTPANMKLAWTVNERQGRAFWTKVGVAFVNRDGSINVRLDAVPISGNLQLREWTPRDAEPDAVRPPPAPVAELPRTADIPF